MRVLQRRSQEDITRNIVFHHDRERAIGNTIRLLATEQSPSLLLPYRDKAHVYVRLFTPVTKLE